MSFAPTLSKSLIYNLSGPILPFLTGAVCIPFLINRIGTERFGLLTIAWTVIGYLTIFDFGLGRSLTLYVSRCLANGRRDEVREVVRSGLVMIGIVSLIGTVLVVLFSHSLIAWMKVRPTYVHETQISFVLLGLAIPLVVMSSGLRGVLESFQRFDVTNVIRVIQGIWTFVGPTLVLPFSLRLDAMVSVLLVGRLATTIAYAMAVHGELPTKTSTIRSALVSRKDLLWYGGWTTLSSLLTPIMEYMDRFFISSVLGAAVVAFYTTPYEVVFRLNFISEGILGVLFPLMAKRLTLKSDSMASEEMMNFAMRLMTVGVFPFVLLLVIGGHWILYFWLGPVFAHKSAPVLQILAIGLLINSFAKVPSNLIQANGRSDVTAKLHLIELPVYIPCLTWALAKYGIEGAALVWSLRMLLDFVLLLWASGAVARVRVGALLRLGMMGGLQAFVVSAAIFIDQEIWQIAYGIVSLAVLSAIFYRYVLLDVERNLARAVVSRAISVLVRRGVTP
jgi:O-antigen/teichoic acid export membrane protein